MQLTELKDVIKGELTQSEEELKKVSEDASIFHIEPQMIVRPTSVEDVKALVHFVNENKKHYPDLSLTARSAGTDMSGGPLTESIVVDMTAHFNHVVEVGDGYAVTEPGVYYRDFEKETLAHNNQIMPSYPASRELCTVGGMVANNSGGEKSLAYGKTENFVPEIKMVCADGNEYTFTPLSAAELEEKKKLKTFEGEIYRKMHELIEENYDLIHSAKPHVSKNSAGYFLWNVWDHQTFDLNKLIVGSQGTLGLITRIKYKLVKKNEHSRMVVMFLKNIDHLGDVIPEIVKYKPESFESFDDKTFKLAIKFFPDLLKRMKGGLFKLGMQFIPEVWMTFTGGVPKLVLIAEFTGATDEEATKKAQEVLDGIQKKFPEIRSYLTKTPQKYWAMRRESFSLLRKHVQGLHTAPFIDDIVIPPQKLPKFFPRLEEILEPYKDKIIYTVAGHMGDGNFHIIPLMDLKKEEQREIIPELSDKVYALVAEFGGSIDGEHNDGIIRTPYLLQMYGKEICDLFLAVKDIWDPNRIFNPHKKVEGSVAAILKYMKKA